MKQTLLAIFFAFFTIGAFAQSTPDGSDSAAGLLTKQAKISVYPNPVVSFISINKDNNVKQIVVFNLVGRKLKTFEDVVKDQQYDVSDLPNGMYLIQIIDTSNKIVTTQRISKR